MDTDVSPRVSLSTSLPSQSPKSASEHGFPEPRVHVDINELDCLLDGSDEEEELPYDTKEAKRRQVNQNLRRLRASGTGRHESRTRSSRRTYSPPTTERQAPNSHLPADTPASGHADWPHDLSPLHETDIRLADAWYNYVPTHAAQAYALMAEARTQQAGALQRLPHIIQQADIRTSLIAVPGIATIKNGWRNDRKAKRRTPERADSCQRGEGRIDPLTSRRGQPTDNDPPQKWADYFREFPNSIPRQLRDHPDDTAVPPLLLIEGNNLLRRFLPFTKTHESPLRAALLSTVVHLFSVSSLYDHLVNKLGLRVNSKEDIRPFTQLTNLSIEGAARWAAECGITTRTMGLLEFVARRYRNFELGRPTTCPDAWPSYPISLNDFPLPEEVPTPSSWETNPSPVLTPSEDMHVGDADGAPAPQASKHPKDGGTQSTAGPPNGSIAFS